jgi:hypothetical protein
MGVEGMVVQVGGWVVGGGRWGGMVGDEGWMVRFR